MAAVAAAQEQRAAAEAELAAASAAAEAAARQRAAVEADMAAVAAAQEQLAMLATCCRGCMCLPRRTDIGKTLAETLFYAAATS
jgi:hypothetical protein